MTLLLIESTVTTSIISSITTTQPSWLGFQPSFAQAQPTISTSAHDLGKPMEIQFQPSDPNGVKSQPKPDSPNGLDDDGWPPSGVIIYSIPANPTLPIQSLEDLFNASILENPTLLIQSFKADLFDFPNYDLARDRCTPTKDVVTK
ncbi:MAG: hypothetical protein NW220_13085 [Leptolyngbyaceae cyanobacterium bins.349]|nr:hypothetical protein [Leptolyngbyaceae cyanobacterium bins.349]